MLTQATINNLKKYCNGNIAEIEGFMEALRSRHQYVCHHRLETHDSDGNERGIELSKNELMALDMYYDRPPCELLLVSRSDHSKLHHTYRKKTAEEKQRIAEQMKKIRQQLYWASRGFEGRHHTDETKERIRSSLLGKKKSSSAIEKLSSYHWYNDGIHSIKATECPDGFCPGRLTYWK